MPAATVAASPRSEHGESKRDGSRIQTQWRRRLYSTFDANRSGSANSDLRVPEDPRLPPAACSSSSPATSTSPASCTLSTSARGFCSNESTGQKANASNVELSLVTFYSHGSESACLVLRTGWTRDIDTFLHWLSSIPFVGGGFNDVGIAEGLNEALMMFPVASNGNQAQQNVDWQRHCILVTASNPRPLPTAVYQPPVPKVEPGENAEVDTDKNASDAEAVARSFAQCSVSLSIICPKQLPKHRSIYNAGKHNPQAADPPIDNVKNPHFLVLVSEIFMEARSALSCTGVTSMAPCQGPLKMDMFSSTPVTVPLPTNIPSGWLSLFRILSVRIYHESAGNQFLLETFQLPLSKLSQRLYLDLRFHMLHLFLALLLKESQLCKLLHHLQACHHLE